MKLIKKLSLLLIIICGLFFIGCKEQEIEKTYEANIPQSIKEGEEFSLEVKEDGNIVSNELVTVILENNLLEINDGVIKALTEGVEHVTVIYNNKMVYEGNVTILSSKITITYDLDGGTCDALPTKYTKGEVIELPTPEKEGYVFCGFRDSNNKLYLELDDNITEDITLKALWHVLDNDGYDIYDIVSMINKLKDEVLLSEEASLDKIRKFLTTIDESILSYVINIEKYNNIENSLKIQKEQIADINSLIESINLENVNKETVEQIIDLYDQINTNNYSYIENFNKFTLALVKADNVVLNLEEIVPNLIEDAIDLPSEIEGYQINWSCSKDGLFTFDNGTAKINKAYLNHQVQTVELIASFEYKGFDVLLSTETSVNPIKYDPVKTSPVAGYFNVGAVSHYEQFNNRDELFSKTFKDTMDIVYYSFINPTSSGGISVPQVYYDYMDEVLDLKNYGVRVLICLGGSGTSKSFSEVAKDDAKLEKFADTLVDFIVEYGFDGIDLDWEYPGYETGVDTSIDRANYTKMFNKLREKVDAACDANSSRYLLTSAIPGTTWGLDRYDVPGLNKSLDYVNIMSYDLNNSAKATHLSPLYSSKKDGGYGFSADSGVQLFVKKGFDKSKLIIGCATYGKVYQLSGTYTSQNCLGASGKLTSIGVNGSFASGTLYYQGIKELLRSSGDYQIFYEKDGDNIVGSYIFNAKNNIFITYESDQVFTAKYQYAKANGIGIMCWSIPEDASDTYIYSIKPYL